MSTSSTTIYSGFHRKLKDRRLKWEDRLKIARYAWTTPAAFIPNKHQVLLDWLFGALLNKKKLKIDNRDALCIWLTINDFVRSNFIKSLASKSKLLSLRSSATQVMTEALSRTVITSDADFKLISWTLGACHAVLTSSPVAFLLTSRTRVLNVVLASSLRLLLQLIEVEAENERSKMNAMDTGDDGETSRPPVPSIAQLKKVVEALASASLDAFLRSRSRRVGDEKQLLQFYLDEVMDSQLRLVAGNVLENACSDGVLLREKLTKLARVVLFDVDHKTYYDNFLRSLQPVADSEETVRDERAKDDASSAPKIPRLIKTAFEKLKHRVLLDPKYVASSTMDGLKMLRISAARRLAAAAFLMDEALSAETEQASSSHIAIVRFVFQRIAGDDLVELFDDYAKSKLSLALDVTLAFAARHGPDESTFPLLVDLLKCDPQILDKVAADVLRLTMRSEIEDHGAVGKERDIFFAYFVDLYKKLRRLDKWFVHLQAAILDNDVEVQRISSGTIISNSSLKTLEDVGRDLPLGTALTIWENLHEAVTRRLDDVKEGSYEETFACRISSLLLVEVSLLQRLVVANHEHPENLSANVHDCVVVMGRVETKTKDLLIAVNLGITFEKHRECRQRLEASLSFYLPRRHAFASVDVFSPPGYGFSDDNALSEKDRILSVLTSPVNWLPYYRALIPSGFISAAVTFALETSFERIGDDAVTRTAALNFLKDESNYEIPDFATELTRQCATRFLSTDWLLETGLKGRMGDNVEVILCFFSIVPPYLVQPEVARDLILKLLSLLDEYYDDFAEEQRLQVMAFCEALLEDFPRCLDPPEESSSSLESSTIFVNLCISLDHCKRILLAHEFHSTKLGSICVSVASKLVKILFRRGAISALCRFLEDVFTLPPDDDGSGLAEDAQLTFALPLLTLAYHGCQRLLQKSNPADDVKVQRLELLSKLTEGVDFVVNDVYFGKSNVVNETNTLSIAKTFLGPCNALIADRRHNDDGKETPVADFMIRSLIDFKPADSDRLLYADCLKIVLRNVGWARKFRDGFFEKRNKDMLLHYGEFLEDAILNLLPPLPKCVLDDAIIPPTVVTPSLPTESFSVLDRFLGQEISAAVDDNETLETSMDDARSDVSHPVSMVPASASAVDREVTKESPSSSSVIDSLLPCLRSVHKLESLSIEGSAAGEMEVLKGDGVVGKMISFISVATIDVDHRRLDLALRYCLDAFEVSESTASFLALTENEKRRFIEAILNLSLGLSLRCKDSKGVMSTIERSVASSVLVCLGKIVKGHGKKKRRDGDDDEEECEGVRSRNPATIAVEALLTLPIPSVDNSADDKPSLSDFFRSYAALVCLLLTTHLHRVVSMAPTFFATIDKLLTILIHVCDRSETAGQDDPSCRKAARECANALLRIMALFRPHKAEFSKFAPYWISHFTRAISTTNSFAADGRIVRDINSCVFCLMDLLDEYGFDILRTQLPSREKDLLHKLKKEYETKFKFQGKI